MPNLDRPDAQNVDHPFGVANESTPDRMSLEQQIAVERQRAAVAEDELRKFGLSAPKLPTEMTREELKEDIRARYTYDEEAFLDQQADYVYNYFHPPKTPSQPKEEAPDEMAYIRNWEAAKARQARTRG